MIELHNFYDFIKEGSKKHKRPNIHAIHFGRLSQYSKSWKLYDIIVFEALLRCHRRFGNTSFTMNTSKWVDMTKISKNTFTKYLAKMEKLGFVKVTRSRKEKTGTAFHNQYLVDMDKITNSLEIIYNFEDMKPVDKEATLGMLKGWYLYLKENSAPKQSKDETSEVKSYRIIER